MHAGLSATLLRVPSFRAGAAAAAAGAAGPAAAARPAAHCAQYCAAAGSGGVCRCHAARPEVCAACKRGGCARRGHARWGVPAALLVTATSLQPTHPHPLRCHHRPLLSSASGETLLLLVQNAELLAKCMPAAAAGDVLPPLLVRAAQHGDHGAEGAGTCACCRRLGAGAASPLLHARIQPSSHTPLPCHALYRRRADAGSDAQDGGFHGRHPGLRRSEESGAARCARPVPEHHVRCAALRQGPGPPVAARAAQR